MQFNRSIPTRRSDKGLTWPEDQILHERLVAPVVAAQGCCKNCIKVFTEIARPKFEFRGRDMVVDENNGPFQHHNDYESLWSAAKSRCQLCRVLLGEAMRQTGSPAVRLQATIRFTLTTDYATDAETAGLDFLIDITYVTDNAASGRSSNAAKPKATLVEVPFRFEFVECQKLQFVYGESKYDLELGNTFKW